MDRRGIWGADPAQLPTSFGAFGHLWSADTGRVRLERHNRCDHNRCLNPGLTRNDFDDGRAAVVNCGVATASVDDVCERAEYRTSAHFDDGAFGGRVHAAHAVASVGRWPAAQGHVDPVNRPGGSVQWPRSYRRIRPHVYQLQYSVCDLGVR